jgi:hypothetical protein
MKRACSDAKHAQGGVQVPKYSKSGNLIVTRMDIVVAVIKVTGYEPTEAPAASNSGRALLSRNVVIFHGAIQETFP